NEVTRQRFAFEQVGYLRLDALVATGDRRNGGGGGDGAQKGVTQTRTLDALAKPVPTLTIVRGNTPRVELKLAPTGARLRKRRVAPLLFRELGRGAEGVKVDVFGNALRERTRFGGIEGQPQLEEHVLQAHDPEPNGAPALIRRERRRNGVVVQ